METLGPIVTKLMATLVAGTALATTTDLPGILSSIMSAGPVIVTINQMEIAKTVLFSEKAYNGAYPSQGELEGVLRKGIGGKPHPHLDEWGTPFRIEISERDGMRYPFVLSLGPDKTAGTADDLKVFIEIVPADEKQASLSESLRTGLLDPLTKASAASPGAAAAPQP